MEPLRFIVRAPDGTLLDTFTDDELATAGTGKEWQEAACWAVVANKQHRPAPTQMALDVWPA